MKTEVKTIESPIYEVTINPQGEEQIGDLIRIETSTVTEITADEGKRFVRKSDWALLGDRITLGADDTEDNYMETELVEIYEGGIQNG